MAVATPIPEKKTMSQSAIRLAEFVKSHQSDKALTDRLNEMFLTDGKEIVGYKGNNPKQALLTVIAKLTGEDLVKFFDTCWDKARALKIEIEAARRAESATLEVEKCMFIWRGKVALPWETPGVIWNRTPEQTEEVLWTRIVRAQSKKNEEDEAFQRSEFRTFRNDLRRAQSIDLRDQREAERHERRPTTPSAESLTQGSAALLEALSATSQSN